MNNFTSVPGIPSGKNPDFLSGGFSYIRQIDESVTGFTRIFKAKRMGKWHILKTLKTEYAGDPEAQQLLIREFEIGYHLSHPQIVQTLGLENVNGIGLAIVMEYVEGSTLRKYISGRSLTRDLIYRIMTELCQALIYLHGKSVVHRNLKPENIMITRDGQHVKLLDFSCSDPESYILLKHRGGSRKYASPEHLADDGMPDVRSDIYSVGVILTEMNETLTIPSYWLRRISLHCRRLDRDKRYASADEVLKRLESRTPRNLSVAAGTAAAVLFVAGLLVHFNVFGLKGIVLPASQITYVHDTLIQVKVDTIRQLENRIQASPLTKETGESYQRLALLLKQSKDLTINLIKKNETLQNDLTVPLSRRQEADDHLFFQVEDAVRREVNKTISPENPQYSIFLNAALGVMEQTFKEYKKE